MITSTSSSLPVPVNTVPCSPVMGTIPVVVKCESHISTTASDVNSDLLCTPQPGVQRAMPVVEAVACRRKAVRKTRRFGGRQSESPYARRRLVYEAEREE